MFQVLSTCPTSNGKLEARRIRGGGAGRESKMVLNEIFEVCGREYKVNGYRISYKL